MEAGKKKCTPWMIIVVIILVVLLGAGGLLMHTGFGEKIIATPSEGETVNLLDGDILTVTSSYTKGITDRYYTKQDCYGPKPVVISWKCDLGAHSYEVKIGTKEDLSDAVIYETSEMSLEVDALYANTHYYYQVNAICVDENVTSGICDFVTAELPRTISIDGVSNTRDIGGYVTEDGKYKVRQGMVYRGAAVDDISASGKKILLETYGIKTDLDLRGTLERSPLGSSVNFVNVSAPHYAQKASEHGIYKSSYQEALATAIRTFANEENYPIYMHCQIGRDRTGTLAFLINALLGVGEEDLYFDYELSFMSQSGCNDFVDGITPSTFLGDHFWSLYNYIDNYEDEGTLSEKTESFMLDLGITAEEIAAIRSIMLEEVVD